MSVRKEYSYPSKTGLANIYAVSWAPDDASQVKAVFQIMHGMAEHLERYEDFANYMTGRGFAVYINDHIGHGKSVKSDDDLGYFGEKDGWQAFIADARALTEIAKEEYPGKPLIVFGHSMGSFVCREYAKRFGRDDAIKGFIFCGTSGPNPATGAGIAICKTISKLKGSRHRSKLIDKIAFGSYHKKYDSVRTPFDWLTRDEAIVDKYIADKYCGFLFTAAGYIDMFNVLAAVSSAEWATSLIKSKPYLIISGAMDPVGAYGAGVRTVCNALKGAGCGDVTMKIYDDCRHEILNETNRADIYADVADWAESKIQ